MTQPTLAQRLTSHLRSFVLIAGSCGAVNGNAAFIDEIQIYADEINAPGVASTELHAVTFPRGRSTQEYQGEVVTDHSLFLSFERAWGLTETLEAGLYVPVDRDGLTGDWAVPGLKARLKWLPIKGDDVKGGWFAGTNVEVGRVTHRFSQVRSSADLRIMLGWRNEDWLLGANPSIGWGLSDAASGKPDYGYGLKGSRRVAEGVAVGLEYYSEKGQIGRTLPWEAQDNKLFIVLDYDRKPWSFNIGIGKGMSHAAEKTTIKAIIELPF